MVLKLIGIALIIAGIGHLLGYYAKAGWYMNLWKSLRAQWGEGAFGAYAQSSGVLCIGFGAVLVMGLLP